MRTAREKTDAGVLSFVRKNEEIEKKKAAKCPMDGSQEAAQDASDAQEPSDVVTEAGRSDKKSQNPGFRRRFAYSIQVFYEANPMRIQHGHVQLGHVKIGQRGLPGQPSYRSFKCPVGRS